jgi:beta-aspartyl-peptidase (threonine type)
MSDGQRWALALHGGAKDIRSGAEETNRRGCLDALKAGQAVLSAGGSALHAVEACVRQLENDPTFNAGYGSVVNTDGEVEMDAAIMDGRTLDIGAVAAIMGVRNPVSVAHAMLRAPPILLVGSGARRFAESVGAEMCEPHAMIAPHRALNAREHDTVGCIARDAAGDMAVAMSTGGLPGKPPGRVGDTPLPGCGYYVKNGVGGVAFSGDGEIIARLTLASRVMQRLDDVGAEQAVADAILRLAELGGAGGAIAIDRDGRIGWAHNSPHFAVAFVTSESDPTVALRR